MTRKSQVAIGLGCAAGLASLAGAVEGLVAASGAGLGLLSVSASMLGTWGLTEVFARAARLGVADRGWIGPVVLLFLKFPVLWMAWLLAERLGPPAPKWFLLGLALVYCLTVAWALAEGFSQTPASDG